MKRPGLWAVLLSAGFLVALFLPQSESYSDFGFSVFGRVDVECGSLASKGIRTDFRDFEEQQQHDFDVRNFGEPRIFEGQTASEVCADKHKVSRVAAGLLGFGAGLLFLVAFVRAKNSTSALAGHSYVAAADPPPTVFPPKPTSDSPVPPPQVQMPTAATSVSSSHQVLALPAPKSTPASRQVRKPTIPNPGSPTALPTPPDKGAATRSAYLTFDDGTEANLLNTLVVGRNPKRPSDLNSASLVSLGDATMTVSKTHFAAGLANGELWIVDLHSSNGVVVNRGQQSSQLLPGHRASLLIGDSIRFGDRQAEVAHATGIDRSETREEPQTKQDETP